MTPDAVLQVLRQGERAEDALAIAGNAPAMRLAVAWSNLAPTWTPPQSPMPEGRAERSEWAWSTVYVPWKNLARSASVALSEVLELFTVIRVNRIVYPDGSMHEEARKAIRAQATVHVTKAGKAR